MGVKRLLKRSVNKGFKRIETTLTYLQREREPEKMANISDANDYEKQKQKKMLQKIPEI